MTTTPEPAAAVLGTPPDLPQGTPAPSSTTPPVAAPPPSTPDKDGNAWDARYHASPPRINSKGQWEKLRGNAARKAKGLPYSGANAGKAPRAEAEQPESGPKPADPTPTPPPAVDPPPTASQPPPPDILGGAPPIKDGVPMPPEAGMPGPRPFADYEPTAAALVDGVSAVAVLGLGQAWTLKPDERRSLLGASQRVLHHYQLPVVGPLLELILVLLPIIGRRRNDPETKERLGAFATWWRNRSKPAAAVDPYRTMPAAGSSAPASATPDAYRDAPPVPPAAPGERRVAWIP